MSVTFVQPAATHLGETSAPPTRLLRGSSPSEGYATGTEGPLSAAALVAFAAVGVVGSRASRQSVACRATKVKKKGVRMVEGKEIPWNLFSPKAPYQGTVVKNQVHEHTITKPNSDKPGDANWETEDVSQQVDLSDLFE